MSSYKITVLEWLTNHINIIEELNNYNEIDGFYTNLFTDYLIGRYGDYFLIWEYIEDYPNAILIKCKPLIIKTSFYLFGLSKQFEIIKSGNLAIKTTTETVEDVGINAEGYKGFDLTNQEGQFQKNTNETNRNRETKESNIDNVKLLELWDSFESYLNKIVSEWESILILLKNSTLGPSDDGRWVNYLNQKITDYESRYEEWETNTETKVNELLSEMDEKWETLLNEFKESWSNDLDSIRENYVGISNNENITGLKNFTQLPTSSITPTDGDQLTNKSYVDTQIAANAAVDAEQSAAIEEINNNFNNLDSKVDSYYDDLQNQIDSINTPSYSTTSVLKSASLSTSGNQYTFLHTTGTVSITGKTVALAYGSYYAVIIEGTCTSPVSYADRVLRIVDNTLNAGYAIFDSNWCVNGISNGLLYLKRLFISATNSPSYSTSIDIYYTDYSTAISSASLSTTTTNVLTK